MRREHQEVLARRAAEEAKVKRLQDQLAAMEGKEKGASPGARGRTTGRGHGGGSAGGTGGAGGAAPGGPAAGDAADSLGDLAGMENQLTSTLQVFAAPAFVHNTLLSLTVVSELAFSLCRRSRRCLTPCRPRAPRRSRPRGPTRAPRASQRSS
jgi:hypothetical protein